MREVDNRGLNCPEPVLRTKKALSKNPQGLISIVDHVAARENVIRMAQKEGFSTRWEEKKGAYYVYITAGEEFPAEEPAPVPSSTCCEDVADEQVILIGTDQFGEGSEELGRLLMRNYLHTLTSRLDFPQKIIFINSGVKLCVEGSPVIEELEALQNKGTEIFVCGTCLDYYRLEEKLAAGNVSNMHEITDLLAEAKRVLSL